MNLLKKLQPGVETLKQLDAYSKPIEDFRVKTVSGGTASIFCWLLIATLLTKRFYEFTFNSDTIETIFVDTSRGTKLRINIDFIIPTVSCDYLALDAMDTSGEQHLHIEHNMFKRRLDLTGQPIEDPVKEESIGTGKGKNDTALATCGSCYGAENPEQNITCCNTCGDVKHAYQLKRWELREIDKIEQCQSTLDTEKMSRALKEGCQIYGYMEVNRVGGSFHIAPGQSFSINHIHVHDVQPYSSSTFNMSHVIRHLSFGRNKISCGVYNPLDNTESIAQDGSTMYQYYIKIVPTMRVLKDGSVFNSNQFSVTKHSKVVSPGSGDSGMPGIFFTYELSALMVKITDKVIPWSHFFNDCCSCIGGVFIVFMLLDSFFYRSVILWKKMEIGKAH